MFAFLSQVRTPAPSGPTPEQEAEALARAETARLEQLVATGQQQLATARGQLRGGRHDDAIATVDAALAALPANPVTQRLVTDLKNEKATALLDRAQALLKQGDPAGARAAIAQYDLIASPTSRSSGVERQIARAEAKPTVAAADPVFLADRAATAQLVAKGRAQYVAGDLDGAQETFRAIEAQEPDNTVAKGFLLRIAEEKTEMGVLNREKTRAQLLEEVSKSWQRPGIYQERAARDGQGRRRRAPGQEAGTEITLPSRELDPRARSAMWLHGAERRFRRNSTPRRPAAPRA
jgi:general secretion pathway protein D